MAKTLQQGGKCELQKEKEDSEKTKKGERPDLRFHISRKSDSFKNRKTCFLFKDVGMQARFFLPFPALHGGKCFCFFLEEIRKPFLLAACGQLFLELSFVFGYVFIP